MTPVCRVCKHLMPEGADGHVCPPAAYAAARDALVAAAAEAEEAIPYEDLEEGALPR